jgi:alpha-L-rhamnosidase
MVSFNHYANGAVGDWLYRRVAGLEAIEPGYKKFKVAPLVGGGLTSVSCFKKLSSGTIRINWNFENGVFVLSINVPFNTSAVITLPDGEMHEVQSGKYSFKTDLKI